MREGLTNRQVEIAKLIAREKTAIEIASELNISVRTVNWHVGVIYKKLDCHNAVGMINQAYRKGIFKIPRRPVQEEGAPL